MRLGAARYAELVAFAKKGGSFEHAGKVLQVTEQPTIDAYVAKLRREEESLSRWGLDEPDDEEDMFADLEEPVKLAALVKSVPGKISEQTKGWVETAGKAVEQIENLKGLLAAHPRIRLRDADGLLHETEVFSHSGQFGYIVQIPVPKDLRTVYIKGQPVEVDFLELQRAPEGNTVVNGLPVSNQKLITLAELA